MTQVPSSCSSYLLKFFCFFGKLLNISSIFPQCLVKCTNFSVEQLKNIPFSVATELGSLEKHEAGINFLTIFNKVKELCLFLGIEDFSLADMLFPEAKRNKRIFAELANFMSFRAGETKNFENYLEISVFLLKFYGFHRFLERVGRQTQKSPGRIRRESEGL